MFLRFANFYYQFILGFNKIIKPFIFILKIINILKNLLILVNITKKKEVIDGNKFCRINKNLSKF